MNDYVTRRDEARSHFPMPLREFVDVERDGSFSLDHARLAIVADVGLGHVARMLDAMRRRKIPAETLRSEIALLSEDVAERKATIDTINSQWSAHLAELYPSLAEKVA